MAFVLTSSQFDSGLQSYSALLLESLRQISSVSPFTIPNVKAALDSGQIQPFDTAGFDQFLNELYSLDLDYRVKPCKKGADSIWQGIVTGKH